MKQSKELLAYLATASLSTPRDVQEEIGLADGWMREYLSRGDALNLSLAAQMAERLAYLHTQRVQS